MEKDRTAKRKMIHTAYGRLMLVSMVVLLATNVCGFIDNIVVSRFLNTSALAALSCFSPISAITEMSYVITLGTVIICGNLIGAGKSGQVNALFTSSFLTLAAVCVVFSTLLIVFRSPIASLLGASGEVHQLLCAYIAGFAPSIVFACLTALMTSLAPYNSAIGISYAATASMFFGNFIFDILLVKPLGVFGIGLASTLSCLSSFLILLPVCLKKNKTVHLVRNTFDAGLLKQALRRGLPSLFFYAGLIIKNALLNYTMIHFAGYDAVAVTGILGSLCGIAGTLSGGCTNAYSSLMSLYWGEEDREGIIDLFRFSLTVGLSSTVLFAALTSALSVPLAGLFFQPGTAVAALGQRMLLLGFWFLPLSLTFNLLMNSYKIQGRLKLVNVLSFMETALIGVLAVMTVPHFGTDAAWLANFWSDLLMLVIILVSVFVLWKRIRLTVPDLLKLPENFGASADEFAEYTIREATDPSVVSETIIAFCRSRGVTEKKAFWAGLCVEELTSNILQHGASRKRNAHVDVRVVCTQDLTLRIQDDCTRFDPRERMQMHHPDSPEKNIGLRIVAGMASDIDYYNNAGINSLIIRI